MNKQERVFLERKPQIFLLGDFESAGFKEAKTDYGQSKKMDDYDITWYEAVITCCNMIFTHTPKPRSLSALWLDNVLYQEETPVTNVKFDEQGYQEFYDLRKAAEKNPDNINALFEYSPPIKDYAIPPPNTYARQIFTYATRMTWDDITHSNENRDKLRR
ncbi:unnamed protein product, partial [marine sediment metagenome]